MARGRWKLAALGALLALAACSLTSLDGLSGGTDDSGAADGSTDAPVGDSFLQDVSVNVIDGCSLTGCFDMPPGFGLVAYGATAAGIACPMGFGQPANVVEGPTLGSNACTCGCSVTTQPSCAGMLVTHQDTIGSGLCENPGAAFSSVCGTNGFLGPFVAGVEHRFTPPAPSGGTCQASATKDASKLTYASQGRVCEVTTLPECNNKVCPPATGGGFVTCIAAAGDIACPAAFPKKHAVGTGASFTCGPSCTCNVKAAPCTGKFDYFASADCSGAVGNSVLVNDTCVSSANGGASYSSHVYVPDPPSGVACTNGGSATPSAPALTQTTTVCCI